MTLKTILFASAVLVGATGVCFAQSMPNYGPNAPATGDSFGKPPSGTHPPRSTVRSRYNSYAYERRHHYRYRTPQPRPYE